jgi:hypothetical protein
MMNSLDLTKWREDKAMRIIVNRDWLKRRVDDECKTFLESLELHILLQVIEKKPEAGIQVLAWVSPPSGGSEAGQGMKNEK